MPYEEQTWIDFNPKFTLSAVRMGHLEQGVANEENRAKAAEQGVSVEQATERTRAKAAEAGLAAEVGAEKSRAEVAEQGIKTEVGSERTRAEAAEKASREQAEAHSVPITQKGAVNGVASLDGGGKVPSSQLPPGEIVSSKTVKKESELVALKPTKTEIVIVEEPEEKAYVWNGGKTGTITDWTALTFTTGVQEVNGKKGATIVLSAANVGADAAGAATSAETAAIAAATTKVNTEKTRAEAAEATVTGSITAETNRAKAAETAASKLATEERTRAEATEAAIANEVSIEKSRAIGAETGLEKGLTEEITKRKTGEKELESSISATNTALASKVSNIDTRLSDERTPLNNSVSTTKIVNGAVTREKLATAVQTELTTALTGPAGGDLAGNYPNPTVKTGAISKAKLSAEVQSELERTASGISSAEAEAKYLPIVEKVNTQTIAANSTLPAITSATIHVLTITVAAPTLTLPATTVGSSITVYIKQDGSGSRKPTFAAPTGAIRWPEGELPTFSALANAVDVVTFVCAQSGFWDGFITGYGLK